MSKKKKHTYVLFRDENMQLSESVHVEFISIPRYYFCSYWTIYMFAVDFQKRNQKKTKQTQRSETKCSVRCVNDVEKKIEPANKHTN